MQSSAPPARWSLLRLAKSNHTTLLLNFCAWKSLLLALAAASPGPGYDTSASLLLGLPSPALDARGAGFSVAGLAARLLRRLLRWDGIYFASNAQHGYRYEQQWAFGWGFSRLVAALTSARTADPSVEAQVLTALCINLVSHLASVLLLYHLSFELLRPSPRRAPLALLAANLHIVAPAGVFLCAPGGESLFSALSFLGSALYLHGVRSRSVSGDVCTVLAGLAFGVACTVRSNGVLNGVMFAADLALSLPRGFGSVQWARRCIALCAGGVLVGIGFAFPQAIAYLQYCGQDVPEPHRPWCGSFPPSIYSFVQQHYWNVGFLNYWTLGNLPLFLLAAPTLALMFVSSIGPLTSTARLSGSGKSVGEPDGRGRRGSASWCAWRFALPQLLLTTLTLTNFHVQIITRIATGHFLQYIWLAEAFERRAKVSIAGKRLDVSKLATRWTVMYAVIQGGLFAGFLPPA